MEKTKVLLVIGPTASGKTALAVKLAKKFNGEVVSADSMQIYKGMNIASAKPCKEEMDGIPHYLIDKKELTERYSVAQFINEATEAIIDITKRGKLPIVCGGTGLYINSLIENIEFTNTDYDENLRNCLQSRLEKEGAEALYKELLDIDREYALTLHLNNTKRVFRALELYYSSGVKMSQQIENSKKNKSPFNAFYIGLNFRDRQKLYNRINSRVDKMIEAGLIDEAKQFYSVQNLNTAAQAIGIKELKEYFDGNESLDIAIQKIKQETRRYAKRQLTWFRRNESINWLFADEYNSQDDLYLAAFKLVEDFLKKEEI